MKKLIIRATGLYLNALALVSPARAADQAFRLFCKPFRTRLNPKQLAFFATASEFDVEAEGYAVKGLKWGSGPRNVLFLHGWQSHSYRWKAYIEALLSTDEYTIYSIDAPGHGLSDGDFLTVPVYSAVIREAIHRIGNVHAVVSHSLGSFSFLYTLHNFPLLPVEKIVVMGVPGRADDFVEVFRQTLRVSSKLISLIEDKFVELYNVKPDYFTIERFAQSLNQSGLIIHDEHDAEAPYRHAEALHQMWKKSSLITTRNLGHNLRSQEVVSHLTSFLSGQMVERTSGAGETMTVL
jgi:pimeloyl-ACP methyl ester carboxylesterase